MSSRPRAEPTPFSSYTCSGSLRALHLELAEVLEHEVALHDRRRAAGQIRLARLRELLHPLREAHRVPHRGVVHPEVLADRPHHHLARVDPDPHREVDALAAPQLGRVGGELLLEVQRRVAGALGVVLVGDRRPEQRHDAVAGELVDGALEAVDALGEDREEAIHHLAPRLGIGALGEVHRAHHVGEENRDLLALALEGAAGCADLLGEVRGGLGAGVGRAACGAAAFGFAQRVAAGVAELRVGRVLGAAARARERLAQGRAALGAETRAVTVRDGHRRDSSRAWLGPGSDG